MEKYGFVYIWRDRKHKRYYVGCHWGRIDDGYICSSNWMRDAYRRRPHDFKRRIIAKNFLNKKDMFEEEYRLLNMIKPHEIGKRYYNLNTKRINVWIYKDNHSEETKNKIGHMNKIRLTGRQLSEDHKENIRKGLIGKNKGKTLSSEQREKMLFFTEGHIPWNKNIPMSEESKKKLSDSKKGSKGPNLGRKMTEETKEKIRLAKIGKPSKKKGKKYK